ncbi:MAG: hypothetical protein JRJ12_01785 [Deltaproteobacteria bacterium]|nr:hypothetical protein [Deltaproteobacteria bacterium]MBW2069902.1 hypothetical protein [Deltaproteobacteria bacterium]
MFRNQILPVEVVSELFCPLCSLPVDFDSERMIADNGWLLEFDMDLARACLRGAGIEKRDINPAFLFDEGYASWNGLTPNDLEQRILERQDILPLAKENMRLYLEEIRRWGCARVQKLRDAGWRKAQAC